MRPSHDVVRFAGCAIGVSILLAVALWLLPSGSAFRPRSALTVVPAVGVIASARGASWRRRVAFAGGVLGAFLLADTVLGRTGAKAYAQFGYGLQPALVSVIYSDLALAVPLAVLFIFVGRTPKILWTPSDQEAGRRKRR